MQNDVFDEALFGLKRSVALFTRSETFDPGFLVELQTSLNDFHSTLGSARVPKPEDMNTGEPIWDDLALQIERLGKPSPLPFGVSPRGAEKYVAEWLKYLGIEVKNLTPARRDGGYDLESDEFLIEVKNWRRDWLPVSALREIYGVSHLRGKTAMVFSSGFLSQDASEFAEEAGIPVFLFNAEEALLEPNSPAARELLERCMSHKNAVGLATYYDLLGKLLVNYFSQSLDVYEGGLRSYLDKVKKLSPKRPDMVEDLEEFLKKFEHGGGILKQQMQSILEIDILDSLAINPVQILSVYTFQQYKRAELARDFIRKASEALGKSAARDD